MKNLFKTLITVITVVCMLSSMTAFAATQTTVTKYNEDASVNVVTTVTGVAADVIVTYLVADSEDATIEANEIKYINQATANGTDDIEFSYAIKGDGWEANKTIAGVQFGSNNADVASALADDEVIYYDIDFSVVDANGAAVSEAAEIVSNKIGNNYTGEFQIKALPGYEITNVNIDGADVGEGEGTYSVTEGQPVVVTVAVKEGLEVYLFTDATVTDGLTAFDQYNNQLNIVSGVGFYCGSAEKAQIKFAKGDQAFDVDGSHPDGIYDAVANGPSSYFAVQLASVDSLDGVAAVQAIAVKGSETVTDPVEAE